MIVENMTPEQITIKLTMTKREAEMFKDMLLHDITIPLMLRDNGRILEDETDTLGRMMQALHQAIRM